ncbi:MAG: hypothetical protein AB1585_03170 [Thermodesulfobacteriota bacterium]
MKPVICALIFFPILILACSCKEVQKKPMAGGVNLIIHDIPCSEVKKKVIHKLESGKIPFTSLDGDTSTLAIGPFHTSPLSPDPYGKIEEEGRLEIKCIDPLSTKLSIVLKIKGLTSDNRWVEIEAPDKLQAYGERFLQKFMPNP